MMRIFLLLFIAYCIISSCRKENDKPDVMDYHPCIEVDSQSIFWSGPQTAGNFSGVFNCQHVEGTAWAGDRTDVWDEPYSFVVLYIYLGGWPKFSVSIDKVPYTQDTLKLSLNYQYVELISGLVTRDDIERIEDRYSLDTTFSNQILLYSVDSITGLSSGMVDIRMVIDTPVVNAQNPDTILYWNCEFSAQIR